MEVPQKSQEPTAARVAFDDSDLEGEELPTPQQCNMDDESCTSCQ